MRTIQTGPAPFLFAGIVLLLSCGPGKQQAQQKAAAALAEVQTEVIPIDSVNGKASLARNFYFVFDGSGSMDEVCAGQKKVDGAREAVRAFLKKVPADANLGLYVFDDGGDRQVVALGPGNHNAFLTAITAVSPNGNTPLGEAMQYGVDRLVDQYKKQLGYGEYRLIAVTDGQANGDISVEAAARYASRFGIPIYGIGLCIGENHPLRTYAYSYRAANSAQDLERALEETVAETEKFDDTSFVKTR